MESRNKIKWVKTGGEGEQMMIWKCENSPRMKYFEDVPLNLMNLIF